MNNGSVDIKRGGTESRDQEIKSAKHARKAANGAPSSPPEHLKVFYNIRITCYSHSRCGSLVNETARQRINQNLTSQQSSLQTETAF